MGGLPGSMGGSRTGIRQVGQNFTLIGNQFRPLKWEVDRAEQVAVALRQRLQVVREEIVAAAAKSEVKWEEEKISQDFVFEKESAVELPLRYTASAFVVEWDPYLNNGGGGMHHRDV